MPEDNGKTELPPVSSEPWVPLPPGEWTEPERWAWERIRTGQAADFNKRYGHELDPKNEAFWTEEEKKRRGLRADFLRAVLLCEPWRGLITHVGVVIVGACFEEPIHLSDAEVDCFLGLVGSRISAGLYCRTTLFKYSFSLQGSFCFHELAMDGAEIKGGLFMRNGRFASARLHGVKAGELSMNGAEFTGGLAMDGAEVKGGLFMRNGRFAAARLLGVKVGGDIAMEGAEFKEELAMDRAEVRGVLFMQNGLFAAARLLGIKVGGQIDMTGAEFTGEVFLNGASVDGELILNSAKFEKELAMDRAEVMGGLFMRNGHFAAARLHGVKVGGDISMEAAEFKEELAMDRAEVMGGLFMRNGHFAAARLHGIKVGGDISMEAAEFKEKLAMDRAEIKGGLFMRNGRFASARLHGARVGGQIDMTGAEFIGEVFLNGASVDGELILDSAKFEKELAMDRAEIKGDLFMRNGRFAAARLLGARVGELSMNGAEFKDELAMDGAEVKGGLFMRNGRFAAARLLGARVGGQLDMEGAEFEGPLLLERLQVAGDLHMRGGEFKEKVSLTFANIVGHILCEGALFSHLSLSDTKADGFYDDKRKDDDNDIWPSDLNLDRFIYNHIRGSGIDSDTMDLADRPASWFVNWLAKHKPYSPQPYQQCAKVLREAGQPWKAAEVLFAGKERERKNSVWYRRAWLWLLRWSVGYGLGWRFKVFPAALGAIVLAAGAIVSFYSPDVLKENHSLGWSLGLSLNRLLPLITLSKDFTDFVFHGWQKAWFIGQALFGWVLAFFIAAGLAGVGKPGGRD